jgi:hypothetical protein
VARYHVLMRDLVFLTLVVSFFALLTFVVIGCARIVGDGLDR